MDEYQEVNPSFYDRAVDRGNKLQRQLDEALNALKDMVRQHCQIGNTLDSMGNSDNADAMRLLHKHGRLQITQERDRRVIGKWIDKEERNGTKQVGEGAEGYQKRTEGA